MTKTKAKKKSSSFGTPRIHSGAPTRKEAERGGDKFAPLALVAALWLAALTGLFLSGLHVAKGQNAIEFFQAGFRAQASADAKSEDSPDAARDLLKDPDADLLASPEDRAVLSYYCGPSALAWALERLARRQGVKTYDRERAFRRAAQLSQPLPGRGTTLLDLKRAASRIAPVQVEGASFEKGENLLDLLRGAPGSAAVVHLSPISERQLTPYPTGHFVSLAFEAPSPEEKKRDPDARPAWRWFDPTEALTDAAAREGRKVERDELEKRLDELSSGYVLLLFP